MHISGKPVQPREANAATENGTLVCPVIIVNLYVGHLTKSTQNLGRSGCLLLSLTFEQILVVGEMELGLRLSNLPGDGVQG